MTAEKFNPPYTFTRRTELTAINGPHHIFQDSNGGRGGYGGQRYTYEPIQQTNEPAGLYQRIVDKYPDVVFALEASGNDRLIPLLDKEVEAWFINTLKADFIHALDSEKPHGSPEIDEQGNLTPRPEDQLYRLRKRLERYLDEDRVGYFPEKPKDEQRNQRQLEQYYARKREKGGLVHSVRVYAPEDLPAFCASEGSQFGLTDIGKAVAALLEKYPDLSLFLIAGGAREYSGMKPPHLRRPSLDRKSYRLRALADAKTSMLMSRKASSQEGDQTQFPQMDTDLLALTQTGWPSLEDMERFFKRSFVLSKRNKGRVKVKQSGRRPGSWRLDFGLKGGGWYDYSNRFHITKHLPLGHIFYPGRLGDYGPGNSLLGFKLEGPRIDNVALLLIPHYHEEEHKTLIWAIGIDFLGAFDFDLARHRLTKQQFLGRNYYVSYYPFGELAFPAKNLPETLFNLGYLLRTAAWNQRQPVVRHSHLRPLTEEQLEHPKALKYQFPKETSEFFADNVTYYINQIENEYGHSVFSSPEQGLEAGISLLEEIASSLDGDPIATMLRLLPAGISFTRGKEAIYGTNIYGWGAFDQNGLFTDLGRHMNSEQNMETLQERINVEAKIRTLYVSLREWEAKFLKKRKMEGENLDQETRFFFDNKIADISSDIHSLREKNGDQDGRKLFFNFLFEIAQGDARKALMLLRPVWCSETEWKRIATSKYLYRLIELDERFASLSKEIAKRGIFEYRIKRIFQDSDHPISILELREIYEARFHTKNLPDLFVIVESLVKNGELTGLGDRIISTYRFKKADLRAEHQTWYCTPEQFELYKDYPRFQTITERILYEIEQGGIGDSRDLALRIGLNEEILERELYVLKDNGLIEHNRRYWTIRPS